MRTLAFFTLAAGGLISSINWGSPVWARELEIPILNLTESPLSALYVSSVENEDWGENVLGEETPIEAGEEYFLSLSTPDGNCFYDILGLFDFSEAEELEQEVFWSVDLCELQDQGGSIVFFQEAFHTSEDYGNTVRVINNSDSILLALTADADAKDLLGNTYLEPGQHFDISLSMTGVDTSICEHDLTALFLKPEVPLEGSIDESSVVETLLPAINLCSGYIGVSSRPIEVQEIHVQNNTDMALAELYLISGDQADLVLNQLIYELPPNQENSIYLAGGCGTYDVLGIFHPPDGNLQDATSSSYPVYQEVGIELCDQSVLTIIEYGFLEEAIEVDFQEDLGGGEIRGGAVR